MSPTSAAVSAVLYFVSMDADGGLSKFSSNKAGAKYGTGYCDAQCPRDIKFINGEANVDGWNPSNKRRQRAAYGTCCSEMDIWEANNMATAYTPPPLHDASDQIYAASGDRAAVAPTAASRYTGVCDPDGCDFNSYRMGDKDASTASARPSTLPRRSTVVTQFLKDAAGELSEIKRFYVQDGHIIPNSEVQDRRRPGNSITQEWCDARVNAFTDFDDFNRKGWYGPDGQGPRQAHGLVMSIWDDHAAQHALARLDLPRQGTKALGSERGACPTTSGVPSEVEAQVPRLQRCLLQHPLRPHQLYRRGSRQREPQPASNPSPSSTTTRPPATTIVTSTALPAPLRLRQAALTAGPRCGGIGFNAGPTTCKAP